MQHQSYEITPRDQGRAFAVLFKAAKAEADPDCRESLMRVAMALSSESAYRVLEGAQPGPEPLTEIELKCIGLREQHAREVAAAEARIEAARGVIADDDDLPLPAADHPLPAPAVVSEILLELDWFSNGNSMNYDVEGLLEHNGVGLVAAIAARRAHERVGEFWPIIEHLDRFFRFAPADQTTQRAREIINDLRTGKLDRTFVDFAREDVQKEIGDMAEGQSPLAWCMARIAEMACWVHEPGFDAAKGVAGANHKHVAAFDASLIAGHLAEAFGEGAALEFARSFETLGREQTGGAR